MTVTLDDIDGDGHAGCDFCCPTVPATTAYPIRVIAQEWTSRPHWWLSCEHCMRLVVTTRRDELARHALTVRNNTSRFPLPPDERKHLGWIRDDHDRFWSARDGHPVGLERAS